MCVSVEAWIDSFKAQECRKRVRGLLELKLQAVVSIPMLMLETSMQWVSTCSYPLSYLSSPWSQSYYTHKYPVK